MTEPGQPDTADLRMQPWDEHNQALVANVHPLDWVNPEPAERYHLVVVGAGTAGLISAVIAAGLGARVALVERHWMGGDCLNVGCVPSKAMISAARVWHLVRNGAAFGAPRFEPGSESFPAAMERMRRLRAGISHVDSAARYRDEIGVDVFLGAGRFVARDTAEVDGKRLRFRRAVVATGARAAAPPIPGLEEAGYLTNESVFSLTVLPHRIAVIGAGPIGCEMAQALARFGSEVTLLDMASQVLIREDSDAARIVHEALVRDGVRLVLDASIQSIERRGDVKVVCYERDGETLQVEAEEILVAVGRKPNIEGLGLEEAGVEHGKDGVKVNQRLQTTNRRIFAAGDVTPLLKFTHLADAHAQIVVQNALFFGRKKHTDLVVPWCTYTSPEIAHVGLYEKEAQERGYDTEVYTADLAEVDRAVLDGEGEGFLRVVLEAGKDRILGATLVAAHAGDMLGELALAVTHKVGLGKIGSTIHPYPTQGEIVKRVAGAWRRTKLTPTAKRIFGWWFRLF